MKLKKLPDVYVNVSDYGLSRTSVLRSGTAALLSFSENEGKLELFNSMDQIKHLPNSRLKDTLSEFFTYSSGNVYAYSLKTKESDREVKTVKSDGCNFEVSLVGKFYKDLKVRFEIKETAKKDLARFFVKSESSESELYSFDNTDIIKIHEFGISVKLSSSDDAVLKAGEYFELDIQFRPSINLNEILAAHETIISEKTDIEYIAYDFDSTSVHWTLVSEDLTRKSEDGTAYLFSVFRVRNIKTNETTSDYINYLESEKNGFSSVNTLVIGQPVVYKDYNGNLVKDIPFGIFLSFLSSKKYYESLNAVQNGQVKGLISLSTFKRTEIEQIYSLNYTGFRYFEGLSGIYLTEAAILSDEKSDFDSVEKIRVMNRACKIARTTLLESFLNTPINLSSETESIKVILKEIIKKEFSINLLNAVSSYDIEINGIEDIIRTNTLSVKIKLMPLGKSKYITNSFTYKI